jgi:hypothetical protein
MELSPKAESALDKVVQQFKSGDLSPIVKIASLQRQGEPVPSDRWSLTNRILAYIQTGSLDCRGYRQWEQAGRHVRKGSRAAFILAPCMATLEDENGERIEVLRGFRAVAVFAEDDTEGRDLPKADYSPRELPPLADVAQRLGIAITYQPLPPGRLWSTSQA